MARTAVLGRLNWKLGEVVDLIDETPRVRSIILDVPEWPGHRAGQHVDVRLTAEDGYQAQRSYSIASPPDQNRPMLTVERLSDGEVSPYLVDELRPGDVIELRGRKTVEGRTPTTPLRMTQRWAHLWGRNLDDLPGTESLAASRSGFRSCRCS